MHRFLPVYRALGSLVLFSLTACKGSPPEVHPRTGKPFAAASANPATPEEDSEEGDDVDASPEEPTDTSTPMTPRPPTVPEVSGPSKPEPDTGGSPSPPAATLTVMTVIGGAVVPGYDPIVSDLKRVELPPRFTLRANVPASVKSVEFQLNGVRTRVDNQAPFLFTEGADGAAASWDAKFGEYEVSVIAYDAADGKGAVVTRATIPIKLRSTGMNPNPKVLSAGETTTWVNTKLDGVMARKTFTGTQGRPLLYRQFTPEFASTEVKYPLLVFLHHRGVRGADNNAPLNSTRLFNGPQSLVSPNGQAQFPSYVIVPQCADDEEWAQWDSAGLSQATGSYNLAAKPSRSTASTFELIDQMVKSGVIDPKRIYVTGESMGGLGSWEFPERRPDLFAATAPMAGYSDKNSASKMTQVWTWVFHGSADKSNPVEGSRLMVAKLRELKAPVVKYTEYQGVDHGGTFSRAWTTETELLPFLFSARKN